MNAKQPVVLLALTKSKTGAEAVVPAAQIFEDLTECGAWYSLRSSRMFLPDRITMLYQSGTVSNTALSLAPIINELEFISKKTYWGHCVRTSPLTISMTEFTELNNAALVVSAARD